MRCKKRVFEEYNNIASYVLQIYSIFKIANIRLSSLVIIFILLYDLKLLHEIEVSSIFIVFQLSFERVEFVIQFSFCEFKKLKVHYQLLSLVELV